MWALTPCSPSNLQTHKPTHNTHTLIVQLRELPAKGVLQVDAHAALLRNLARDLQRGGKVVA